MEGVRFTDDSMLYFAAATVLITCKLECPQAKIRLLVHAVHRLNYRRKQRVPPIIGSLAAAATLPAISPEVYDALKRQIVQAEWIVLVQLGFQTTVECPHKFVFPFLAFMIDRSASTESNDLFVSWSMEACKWLNDCSRICDVNPFDASLLACVALEATQPMEAAAALPVNWYVAFGASPHALKECKDAFRSPLRPLSASQMVDSELALYQTMKQTIAEGRQIVFSHADAVQPPTAPTIAAEDEALVSPAAVAALLDLPPPPPLYNVAVSIITAAATKSPLLAPAPPPPPPLPVLIDIGDDISVKRKEKKEKRDKKDRSDDKRDYSPVGDDRRVTAHVEGSRKRSRTPDSRARTRTSSPPAEYKWREDSVDPRRDSRRSGQDRRGYDDSRHKDDRYRDDRYKDERHRDDRRSDRDDRSGRYDRSDDRDDRRYDRSDDRDRDGKYRDSKYRDEGSKRGGDSRGGRR
jgi:hypothetical protein